MRKNIFTNLTLIFLLASSVVACDKSSFKIRDGQNSKIASNDQAVQPEGDCQADCEPVIEPPVEPPVYPPVTEPPVEPPVTHPPVEPPTNDPYACEYGKELFGSVAYIIQGQNNLELMWNYFQARGPADPQVAYYQVVVMDSTMTEEGTFKSKYLDCNHYQVHPGSMGIDGQRLDSKIDFKYGNWYWYKLIALDKNYNVVNNHQGAPHIRKFDIGMDGTYQQFYRISGYCDGNF